ncbi:hypothetical protein BJ875DRAFT_535257 [Amylocarpus encephaloides]|uniref:Uncharacterized protein n=1 Tax=Amylocarpus encephaloides TaxID=45428 RepID=A0A9P7YH24_9HELO|nr:hypothetical protein BJ875DRAFT_535257 [Amylocarpus encephaloides]
MSLMKEKRISSERTSTSSLPLLPDPQDYDFGDENLRPKKRQTWCRPLFLHTLIFATYTLALMGLAKSIRGQNCHADMIFSPARGAVKYELVHAENDLMKKSPYAGFPSPEGDQAWRDLLRNSNIRISGDELKKLNRSSIQLQDGSGDYFGGLSAHHHLHCIKSKTSVNQ